MPVGISTGLANPARQEGRHAQWTFLRHVFLSSVRQGCQGSQSYKAASPAVLPRALKWEATLSSNASALVNQQH